MAYHEKAADYDVETIREVVNDDELTNVEKMDQVEKFIRQDDPPEPYEPSAVDPTEIHPIA